jgi:2-phospho-L-lactate transferase/gluconeogenesis factor (CofD/UPF0052 family)
MAQSHTLTTPAARVVLFSGGRGSGVLSKQLLRDPRIQLTLAINGYDDGASTGRSAASSAMHWDRPTSARMPRAWRSNWHVPATLVDLLDARLPDGLTTSDALAMLRARAAAQPALAERVEAFAAELARTGRPFDFNDCSVGNLVFAGSFLLRGRRFNDAVDDYCALLSLPAGLIENVSDGNQRPPRRHRGGRGSPRSEEEIVGAAGHNRSRTSSPSIRRSP